VKLLTKNAIAVLVGIAVLLGMGTTMAQTKIRYIDSQKVLENYPEWTTVQKKLDDMKAQYEKEFNQKQQAGQQLLEEVQSQSLLLSPEKKAEKEAQLQQLQVELERFYYEKLGPQGELFRKQQEMTQPIIDKINTVIKRIGDQEGYDFILDTASGLLYAKPDLDITDRVLEELSKTK
jgi:Skp family chaperone for outer membrane proteins